MKRRALGALCDHLGVERSFDDGGSRRSEVPDECTCAILAALGHPLRPGHEDDDAAARLAQLRDSEAACVLPPAVVLVGEKRALRLRPRLPIALAGQALRWRITLEDGGERKGMAIARRAREGGAQEDGATAAQAAGEGADEGAASGRSSRTLPMTLLIAIVLPLGRHRLALSLAGAQAQPLASADLFVCPPTCFAADQVSDGKRLWGPVVDVYTLRSAHNWGIGDFGDLRRMVDLAADAGAHFVSVNPLHALFAHDPGRASPYRPSNREWLNVLYLDVEAIRELGDCREAREMIGSPAFGERLKDLRSRPRVDYSGVAAAKFEILEALYRHFRASHLERATRRAGLFRDFQRAGGRSLRLHALFDCLQQRFHALDRSVWGWPAWPAAYHDACGPAVEAFERDNEDAIEFFEYLQWQAEGQLNAVAQRAAARGMRVGLCRDLAAGVGAGGSETWSQATLFAAAAHAGAPPDDINPAGLDWGFPPPLPQQRSAGAYAAFLAGLRANMRHAGALRIAHVTSLMRLFWRPAGAATDAGRDGAYVRYPMPSLFALLCLESRRQRCIVIGEAAGSVPQQISVALAQHGVLAYRPLYPERTPQGRLRAQVDCPRQALVAIGRRAQPTLRGRFADAPGEGSARDTDAARARSSAEFRFLARTPAVMAAVALEDVIGRRRAVNLPASGESSDAHWRRRMGADLADIAATARWHAVAAAMNAERPLPPLPVSGSPRGFRPEAARLPRATYRLQLHGDFGFTDAEAALPYLADLGISDVYASPFLRARPGSRHGYDIVDHQAINPEIGTPDDFDRYCARLAALGLGQIADVVPNHVGVLGADNGWWLDVLENGQSSAHARHFDIDWEPPFAELRGKVLLPVLGDQYGSILEAGELRLDFCPQRGDFSVHYFAHRFPIDPVDYPLILVGAAGQAGASDVLAREDARWTTLLDALRKLPPRTESAPALVAERRRNKEVCKMHLAELYARLPALRAHIATRLAAFSGRPGEPQSFDALNELLERQSYRLASWRVAADDINYRRFFDVNDLAALRVENDEVFEATHAQIFRWLAEGRIHGLRIDHPDGLADPAAYFERLQSRYAQLCGAASVDKSSADAPTLYVVVEKIVGEFEALPAEWPIHGDTGYRFANWSNQLFVDAAQESRFSRVYRSFTGEGRDFGEVLLESRKLIMTHSLAGELGGLSYLAHDIAQRDRRTRDFTRSRLRGALIEIVAGFPVYRSYIGPRGISDVDRRVIEGAVDDAAQRALAGDVSVLHFVRDILLSAPGEPDAIMRRLKLAFARRFQQFTAPVMAKAMEDTAFYRYHRLVALNEVGGDPRSFGTSVDDFHAAIERLSCTHPFGLLASSTHDSKRSEDVRARIDVLSEMPGAWRLALRRWGRINARRKSRVGRERAPSNNDEYLFYQTLLGVWPQHRPDAAELAELADRVAAYMLKAAREAKQQTSWMNPDASYEAALTGFVKRVFAPGSASDGFFSDFLPFQATVAYFGCLNSLAMLLLKLTAPGIPDIYQGCELWNLSLVDPDNRRAVDFAAASDRLAELQQNFPQGAGVDANVDAFRRLVAGMSDGRIKLYLLWRALQARKVFAPLRRGRYIPLEVSGPAARHVVAFARTHAQETVVVIVTRLLYGFSGGDPALVGDGQRWAGTVVALHGQAGGGIWRDALSGRTVAAAQVDDATAAIELSTLFDVLPLALLTPDAAGTETRAPAAEARGESR